MTKPGADQQSFELPEGWCTIPECVFTLGLEGQFAVLWAEALRGLLPGDCCVNADPNWNELIVHFMDIRRVLFVALTVLEDHKQIEPAVSRELRLGFWGMLIDCEDGKHLKVDPVALRHLQSQVAGALEHPFLNSCYQLGEAFGQWEWAETSQAGFDPFPDLLRAIDAFPGVPLEFHPAHPMRYVWHRMTLSEILKPQMTIAQKIWSAVRNQSPSGEARQLCRESSKTLVSLLAGIRWPPSDLAEQPAGAHAAGNDPLPAASDVRAPLAEAKSTTPDNGELPALDDEDERILRALAKKPSSLQTQDAIAAESEVSRRTISDRMKLLLHHGLVERPKGPKSGTRITPAGQTLLKQIDDAKLAR